MAPYRQIVEQLLAEGVEMTAILGRLRQDHGYTGSYSSLVRFVHHLRPPKVEPHLRVHTAPGEEAQVDFSPKDILNTALDKEPLPEGVLPFTRREVERVPRRFAFAREAHEFLGLEVEG